MPEHLAVNIFLTAAEAMCNQSNSAHWMRTFNAFSSGNIWATATCSKLNVCHIGDATPVESHSKAQGNILPRPLWGGGNLHFFLEMVHSGALYYLSDGGAPNVVGPGVTYPTTPPSRRAWMMPTRRHQPFQGSWEKQ